MVAIFKHIYLGERACILIDMSLRFVSIGQVDNNSVFVRVAVWHRITDKPLLEPLMIKSTDGLIRCVNTQYRIFMAINCLVKYCKMNRRTTHYTDACIFTHKHALGYLSNMWYVHRCYEIYGLWAPGLKEGNLLDYPSCKHCNALSKARVGNIIQVRSQSA